MKKLIIFDLDGVIYLGDEPLPQAPETLKNLRNQGLEIRFLTNNSTRSRKEFAKKLERMGIRAAPDEIMSSSFATRIYLDRMTRGKAKIFIVGEQGIHDELEGYEILGAADRTKADFVVVGYDREFNYEKMSMALDALLAGAEMIATNRDVTYPLPGGRILPGGGAIVAGIAAAWEKEPYCCGKPNPMGIEYLIEKAGLGAEDTLLVGDRADSDMITGNRAGVETCLTLTGITRPGEVDFLTGELAPTYVINDLGELPALLERRSQIRTGGRESP